jgi:type II secretion system protein N
VVDSARASASPLAIFGHRSFRVTAEAMSGEIDLRWTGSKKNVSTRLDAREIAMADVPGIKEAINLPLAGTLDLTFELDQPEAKFAQAHGSARWLCSGCAIGDGKAKLKITGDPLLGEGLTLPRIRLGDFAGTIEIEKGAGRLQAVRARSPDVEITIEGQITFADPQVVSNVDLYVRFKPSEPFVKSAGSLGVLLQVADAGKAADGFYGFRLSGPPGRLGSPRWLKSSPFASAPAAPARTASPAGRTRPGGGTMPVVRSLGSAPSPATAPTDLSGLVPSAPPAGPAAAPPVQIDPTAPGANVPRYPTEAPPEPMPAPPSGAQPASPTFAAGAGDAQAPAGAGGSGGAPGTPPTTETAE